MVATKARWPLFAGQLEKRGWHVDELEAAERLFVVDADSTLATILEDGKPSRRRFDRVVGGLIDQAAGDKPNRRIRVFGEMVDILCRRGDVEASDALEGLWNRLGERRNFSLLCGYKIDIFDSVAQLQLVPQVCRAHTHVLPLSEPDRMKDAIDAALVEALGASGRHKVYAQVAQHAHDRKVDTAQLALTWVSAHMPRAAERILKAAQTHYLAAADAA